ncbi:MAG: peptidase S10 [Ancalomicrobiaceae bacterium]|nr:peptidase S10 [Ancalomicrobiaceae bacterium]
MAALLLGRPLTSIALLVLLLSSAAAAEETPSAPQPEQTQAAPQPANPSPGPQPRRDQAQSPHEQGVDPPAAEKGRLPADSVTHQTIALMDRRLAFTATAGSIRLADDKGEPEADIAYTAYQLDGQDTATRPVTFFFNGGPGSASAWLQLGNTGPWRIAMSGEALSASAPPELHPNAETWLDFTDLVFIDPVGTGYSHFATSKEEVRKRYLSVEGDARSIALTIRRWLEQHNRLTSPKFVVGESYGGIRGPKVVRYLQSREGVGVRGLILISPVIDFREYGGTSLLHYVASLPTMAAVAREAKAPVTRADMADVEHYAATDFLIDLVKGEVDTDATNRVADRLADLTGLDRAVTRRLAGRLDANEFRREFDRRNGRVTGAYDASVSGIDPYPDSSFYHFEDPSGDPLIAPLTSAVVDLTRTRLNWRPEGSYQLLNSAVNDAWDWKHGPNPPGSIGQLRQILAGDPKLKLVVAHGLFDLVAPYFGSKMLLDQLPAYAGHGRVKLVVYPGGHMFYSRDASRQALRSEAEAMMK